MGIKDFVKSPLNKSINSITKDEALNYLKSDEGDLLTVDAKKLISEEIRLTESIHHDECENCSGSDKDDDNEDETLLKGEEIFSKLVIDWSEPLYNTSKIPKVHFIVPTSQQDWKHDACQEKPGSVQDKISNWCKANLEKYQKEDIGDGQTLTCSVTSLPINIMDIEVMKNTKNNVLILPHFLWINDLRSSKVDETLNGLIPDLLSDNYDEKQLLSKHKNLSIAREKAFVFICSHTTRDKRCGVTAPYLKKVFDRKLQKYGLYRDNSDLRPDGVNVKFISHMGGHKFVGNVQIYLKETRTLIWLGRVTPKHVISLVDYLIIPREPTLPFPEKVRCIKKYKW